MHDTDHFSASRRFLLSAAAISPILAGASPAAKAESYPVKPIRMLLPYVVGGSGDIFTRSISEIASQAIGQPIIVDPKPGAGGGLGAEILSKSSPDGYTVSMIAAGVMTINPHIYKKLTYDPFEGLAPLSIGATMPLVIVVNASLPVKSLPELIEYARKNPGLTYGSAGTGSSQHLAGELFRHTTKLDLMHVPYKGGAAAMADLLGGHLSMQFVHMPSARGHLSSGKIRALAVTSTQRNASMPDVPTVAESGVPDYSYEDWFGFVLPKGVPADISKKLHSALVKGMEGSRDKFLEQGMVVVASTPAEMAERAKREYQRWGEVLRTSNLNPN